MDSTKALQAALDSGAGTVIVEAMPGGPWIVGPGSTLGAVRLRSNTRLVLEPGVELQAERGKFQGTGTTLLQGTNVDNVGL